MTGHQVTGSTMFLTDISPRDKPWDVHKQQSGDVAQLYRQGELDRYADRMGPCSERLHFGWLSDKLTGQARLRLTAARFCRVRHCPVCQWRRSLMWVARFLRALPAVEKDFPKARWIFMTLTVRNCDVSELRATLQTMNAAWQRMVQLKSWPALGFVRSVEVTRGKDGTAHPHFHCLLMVPESYFQGAYYLSQKRWSENWQKCLRANYTPVVDVRAVKPGKGHKEGEFTAVQTAIAETLKYSVKPDDLVADQDWLIKLTDQLHKTRAITLGGVLKNYLSENEPEDLINTEELLESESLDSAIDLVFGWRDRLKRYQKE